MCAVANRLSGTYWTFAVKGVVIPSSFTGRSTTHSPSLTCIFELWSKMIEVSVASLSAECIACSANFRLATSTSAFCSNSYPRLSRMKVRNDWMNCWGTLRFSYSAIAPVSLSRKPRYCSDTRTSTVSPLKFLVSGRILTPALMISILLASCASRTSGGVNGVLYISTATLPALVDAITSSSFSSLSLKMT